MCYQCDRRFMLLSLEEEGLSVTEEPGGPGVRVGWCWPRCCREGRASCTYWMSMSQISSPAGPPSPAHRPILSEPVKPSDPSVPVPVTSTRPVSGQCHPQQSLMSSPDALSIQGPKSSASPFRMTRWTGVRTGPSIIQSATPTLQ